MQQQGTIRSVVGDLIRVGRLLFSGNQCREEQECQAERRDVRAVFGVHIALAEDGADVEAPNAGIKILDNSGTDNTAICSGDKVSRVDIVALRE